MVRSLCFFITFVSSSHNAVQVQHESTIAIVIYTVKHIKPLLFCKLIKNESNMSCISRLNYSYSIKNSPFWDMAVPSQLVLVSPIWYLDINLGFYFLSITNYLHTCLLCSGEWFLLTIHVIFMYSKHRSKSNFWYSVLFKV